MEDARKAFEPFVCNHTTEDGLHFITCPEINLMVWGDTLEEAVEAALFVRGALIQHYALAPDHELTADAIVLKHTLQKMAA